MEGIRANEFIITGRIINRRDRNNGDSLITIASRNGKDVYPKVLCPKGMLPEKTDDRVHVKATGHIIAKTHINEDKRVQYDQTLVADSIALDQTIAEARFGKRGIFFPEPSCKIYLGGRVRSSMDDGGWIRLQIEVNEPREEDGMLIRMSMKKLERQPRISYGDNVCVAASLSTPKKRIGGRNVYFEDILVEDIAID